MAKRLGIIQGVRMTMTNEQLCCDQELKDFKVIPNFIKYAVSKEGYIYSFQSKRLLNSRVGVRGYNSHWLRNSTSGKRDHRYVHRLVAEAFIPNPENKPFINHIDGNKLNNHISNLEWCTAKENVQHSFKMGLARRSRDTVKSKAVIQLDLENNIIQEFVSVGEATHITKITSSAIAACCRKEKYRHKAGGYKWRYKHEQ